MEELSYCSTCNEETVFVYGLNNNEEVVCEIRCKCFGVKKINIDDAMKTLGRYLDERASKINKISRE